MEVSPSFWGKLSTALQLLAVSVVLVALVNPSLAGPAIENVLFPLSGSVTAIAGLQYMYRGLVWLHRSGLRPAADATSSKDRLPDDQARRRAQGR
jgi:hypothetical protein